MDGGGREDEEEMSRVKEAEADSLRRGQKKVNAALPETCPQPRSASSLLLGPR